MPRRARSAPRAQNWTATLPSVLGPRGPGLGELRSCPGNRQGQLVPSECALVEGDDQSWEAASVIATRKAARAAVAACCLNRSGRQFVSRDSL